MKKIGAIALLSFLFLSAEVAAQTDEKEEVMVFTRVEKEARFPGGAQGWKKYLEGNLNGQLGEKCIPLKKGEKSAMQTVRVQFIVDKAGNVSDVVALNKSEVHPKLAAEAIRVIKDGPKWEPAEQNGRKVIYQALQYITWLREK